MRNLNDVLGDFGESATYGVEMVGPFTPEYKVAVNGYVVPHLTAVLIEGTEDQWNLICDGRFMMQAPDHEVRRWLWFIANAMAVAAGYSSHGEHSCVPNPYRVQMSGVSFVDREEQDGA